MHYELEKCGKRSIFLKNYWRYYLLLERRFQDCEQYVEISEENYKTYSMEFVNLILSIGSEVDVVLKEMCGFKQEEKRLSLIMHPQFWENVLRLQNKLFKQEN